MESFKTSISTTFTLLEDVSIMLYPIKSVPGSIPNIVEGFCREVVIFTAVQLNKNIKLIVNYFLGPVLFAWLSYSIYRQIIQQPQLHLSWQQVREAAGSSKIFFLFIPIILIFFNWGFEAWKWKISVANIHRISFWQSFKAVLSGVTFTVTLPNRIGEYLGRVVYLPEGQRLKTISVTLVGSFAQLVTTLMAGAVGLMVLSTELQTRYPQLAAWKNPIFYGLLALIIIMLLIYFNVSGAVNFFNRRIRIKKYLFLVEALSAFHRALLLKILAISIMRYAVFIIQYICLFYFFGVDIGAMTIAWLMTVVFLALAIIPSIPLVELGVRGEVSLQLLGLFSANSLGIGLTTITVWFINLVFPAIIGSLLLVNLRIFRKKNAGNRC